MYRSTLVSIILFSIIPVFSFAMDDAEEPSIPTNRWFYCSGDMDQPVECGEPGFPHIAVYDDNYEGVGLSCGIDGQLSIFAMTADIAPSETFTGFALDVMVEGFDLYNYRDVSYLPPHRENDAALFMQLNVEDSLVVEIARGNTVWLTISHETEGVLYENAFSLKDSAKSIRALRTKCADF